jgi:hypothetical protein
MLTSFLTAHCDLIFWAGVAVEVAGQLWLLFASYACDVSLARWTLLFPPIAIYLAFRYPEECVKPVIVCVVGVALIWAGEAYTPPQAQLKLPNPYTLPN